MSKPQWLKKKIISGALYKNIQTTLKKYELHTVCEKAHCPNRWECYSKEISTFLILGDKCTRTCRFCAIEHNPPSPPDTEEPIHIAEAIRHLNLKYVVITSVTRDDLPDGGANHFASIIMEIRRKTPDTRIEVLIPDFNGSNDALSFVVCACPDVIGHNVETVPRLYSTVRPGADYHRSIQLLKRIHELDRSITIKSGLMLGMGETPDEIRQVLTDLLEVNCAIVTLGQYLQPSKELLPVKKYIPPYEFEQWKEIALKMGFQTVASGPFVRSSYNANEYFNSIKEKS
ncbi:MAG TPA: lipoyl synthase [bacterium]|nr:lipoyl synthase [bacterium]